MKATVKALDFEGYESDPVWLYRFQGEVWGTSNLYLLAGDCARCILDRIGVPRNEQDEWIRENGHLGVQYETTESPKLSPQYRNQTFESSFAMLYHSTQFEEMQA